MRRIVALGALVLSAWYLRKRWRSIGLQGGLQTRLQTMVTLLRAGVRGAPAMLAALAGAARLGALAGAARARAEYVRARAMATASTAAGMARGVSNVGVRKAEEGTSAAAQGAADAAANLQKAPGTVADQAEQAAKRVTDIAAEVRPLSPVGGEPGATGVPEPPKPTAGESDTGGPATPTTGME
jgi:hypothetical protein